MTVDFCDYFWGEKNNGFNVLYQNMKYGLGASKELAEFFRERSVVEESHSKLLGKLAKQAGGNNCTQGTFAPLWQILKASSEKLSTLHSQMVQQVQDLIKEVNKYSEELQKKHKMVKEEECGTLEVVQLIQTTTTVLQRAKDVYTQRGQEVDKLKRDGASAKELEKAEVKLRKAQEDYRSLVDKYTSAREQFERKMTLACKHFQDVEEAHLRQMKEFLSNYSQVMEDNHNLIGQVHVDFRRQCDEMNPGKLLEQFVLGKHTGLERPVSVEFEELIGMSSAVSIDSSTDVVGSSTGNTNGTVPVAPEPVISTKPMGDRFLSSAKIREAGKEKHPSSPTSAPTSPLADTNGNAVALTRNTSRGSRWFLRSRRNRQKKKAASNADNTSGNVEDKSDPEEKDDSHKSETPTPEVDEEGYSIRPKGVVSPWENDKSSFYSSSDSDSEDERDRKLHVEIKPLSNGSAPMSASVDELRATVETLSLNSPLGSNTTTMNRKMNVSDSDNNMKRSQSMSQQLGGSKGNGVGVMSPLSISSASSPTALQHNPPYSTLQSPTPMDNSQGSRYADLGDIFSEVGDIQPALPPKHHVSSISRQSSSSRGNTPTPGCIAIPRPPSRRGEPGRIGGTPSPSPLTLSRTDSVGSLELPTSASSRGPSPLNTGSTDSIPIAVAFHEMVHAYFRGADETKCQVKLTGELLLSFPTGILQAFNNLPSPPSQLSFKIKNANKMETIVPNKQLLALDDNQSSSECLLFDFHMSALTALLKKQAEQNSNASYFNVDVLKYQMKVTGGAQWCPLQLVSFWKCSPTHTDLRVDFKYNAYALSVPCPLLNLTLAVPIDGGVKNVQAKPNAQWLPGSNRSIWKFTELSQHSEKHGVGSLRARFELSDGPSSPGPVAAQFNCEGTTLSGAEFELNTPGFRVSFIKKKFISGKYICDADDSKYRYAVPPGTNEESPTLS